ncbi:MAG: SCP2 sterol-binding domain-containing protein [Chloroflexota bacterium]|nr:SCP2 sterol-binding domain-containing protein [Chloroflexota bacterium]
MAYPFPSDAWIKDLSNRLNESESYERSAKDWEGDFLFVVEPDEKYDETGYLYLGLFHGRSTGAAVVESEDARETEFVIRAPYGTWKQVIEGKLDPIQGIMTKQLKLSGNMMKVMRYPKAAQEIVACCAEVPTEWEGA